MKAIGLGLSLGLALAASATKRAAPPPAPPPKHDAPVHVTCDDMVVLNRQQTARCEGHVHATRDTLVLTCERSVAHYDQAGRIVDLTCLGNVRMVDRGRNASADRGVYRDADRIVELTGHATVKQGEDVLNGEPILFYVDEDRVVAKGAKLLGRTGDLPNASSKPGTDGGRGMPAAGAREESPAGADGGEPAGEAPRPPVLRSGSDAGRDG